MAHDSQPTHAAPGTRGRITWAVKVVLMRGLMVELEVTTKLMLLPLLEIKREASGQQQLCHHHQHQLRHQL